MLKFPELNYNADFTNKCIRVHGFFLQMKANCEIMQTDNMQKQKQNSSNYNLHMQNTRGMKAPMATKMGSMAEPSSFSYGSWALGPLGFRFFTDESLIWSDKVSSSVSLGNGGNWGQSEKNI